MGVLQDLYGGLTGGGTPNEQNAFNRDLNEGDLAQTQGGALQNQGTALQGQFGNEYLNQNGLQGTYRNQADTAYGQLQTTPGYTDAQAAAIYGNPNAGFNYYDPSELKGDTSDYANSLNRAAAQGQQYLQAAPTNQTNWQGGINSKLESSGNEAVSGLEGGLGSAVSGYGTSLDSYQLTPEEAQNIRNVAAQTTQGQYRKMNEETAIQAAAQGNTSPAALAAIKENLGRQGAIDAGNAASAAELAANQEAANRKLTAANNLYGAQSNAANQIYGARQGTAANLASTETQANESIAANQGAAANAQANLGYNAAQTGGAQKLATDTGLQSTGQNLATSADTNASNRSTTTANQAIAGQNAYRNYLTGQQGAAQAASQTAGNQQLSAYGGTTSAYGAQQGAVNNANAAAGNVAVGANSTSQNLQGSFLADGGTIVSPTTDGYDDIGLPQPKPSETPDIFQDYREQINPDGVSGGGGNTTKRSLSSSNGSPVSSGPTIGAVGVGGGGGGSVDSNSGFSGPSYNIINAPPDYNSSPDTTQTSTDESIDYGSGMQPADPVGGDAPYDPYSYDYPDTSYQGDGNSNTAPVQATIAERGPEAVVSTKRPSRYRSAMNSVATGLEHVLSGRQMPTMAPQSSPAVPAQPPSPARRIANGVESLLTGRRYMADGGMVTGARGDGASVPGNEPGGAQGQYGWQGNAANQMAAGGPAGGAPATAQYRSGQPQHSMRVFTRPTNVMLGGNGTTDTVVPLNPGPNAKVTPSQMGIGQTGQAPMPSRYRAATGPKGMVGPQMRPMRQQQGQFAA